MLLGFGGIAFWQLSTHLMAGGYLLFLVVQYLLVRRAAKNHGERFVTTVLAIKAAGDITN